MRSSALRSGSSRTLTILLVAVVLTPSVALVWLGMRLIEQDRALLAQRETERRDAVTEAVARSLSAALENAAQLSADGAVPAGAAVLTVWRGGVRLEPATHVLWAPGVPQLPEIATDRFVDAERSEFQGLGDRGRSRYAAQARSPDSSIRAGAILRLARLHRSQGEAEEALRSYRQLAAIRGVSMDGTPVDLIGHRMVCDILERSGQADELRRKSIALRQALLDGMWVLDRAAWELAASDLSRWNAAILQQDDRQALSAAADWVVSRSRTEDWPRAGRRVIEIEKSAITVIWELREDGLKAILLGPRLLTDWVGVAARGDGRGVANISLLSDTGTLVAGPKLLAGLRTTVRSGAETGLPWTLAVSGPVEEGLRMELQSRRRLLGSGLAALSLLLAGGSYLLWRVVKRELAIARLQGDFVAAVSHEFRTPLTALRHITELLQESDDLPADRRRSFYAVLGHSTERLHRLVESLLDFARMEDGQRPWELQTLNLADLLCRIVDDFRREHPGRLVSFTTHSSSTPIVRADDAALTQAVWNLLDNAAKYSPDGGEIEVTLRAASDRIAIVIRDQGLGVHPDERREIFRKFVRGGRATELGIKGTGLGLALVRHIVTAHGGSVHLDSEEGRGSTFTIELPQAPSDVEAPSTLASASNHAEHPHR
jgi:signal transduction histidine kinase